MTKLSVSPEFEKGLSRKSDIEALKAGKKKPIARKLPKWLTDLVTLLFVASIGGACTWVAVMWMQ